MNSNTVLKRIITLLSAESKEEVSFVTAELVDGTVVESATFDVGETVEVVSADGEKSLAPDGEHELFLRDEEGNEVRIRIITENGVITERMNVEEASEEPKAEEEMSSEETPETTEKVEMEEEEISEEKEEVVINLEEVVEKMSYRIEELEKKIAEMQVEEEVVEEEETMEEEELPKLDGAPVMASKTKVARKADGKKLDRQSAFLSKLYK
jgi:hypothetical protein